MNIDRHPLIKQSYDLIHAIEDCGASEKLTKAIIMAGDLMTAIDKFLDSCEQDKCNCCGMDMKEGNMSDDGYDEADLVLADITCLVTQSEKPTTYTELGELLWKAFNLGKKYRDVGGKR